MNTDNFSVMNTPLNLPDLVIALLVGALLAFALRLHFTYFARAISNRAELVRVIPFITLTIILVISVVKSSLALSLGLVGALSIVRFRTPIKEPEELAYIFMAIAIGLGLGANQLWQTVGATSLILVIMSAFSRFQLDRKHAIGEVFLNIVIPHEATKTFQPPTLNIIKSITADLKLTTNMNRLSKSDEGFDVVLRFSGCTPEDLEQILSRLSVQYPNADYTVVDQHNLPTL